MNKSFKIRKYSGDLVDFDVDKLIRSLKNAKADDALIEKIVAEVQNQLYDGITTKKIYQMAYKILKSKKTICASRYKLKKAIMELGPSGFPFEKFVSKILNNEGFKTEVGVFVQGYCVQHEVDVVAKNDTHHYMVECKYHNSQGRVNSVKIPLYIQSRFLDIDKQCKIKEGDNSKFHQGWIYTNTRFTSDAINYAKCAGLKLVSWDYPLNKSLKDIINKYGLFPITSMATLTKKEKAKLLEKGIVLCKDLCNNPDIINEVIFDRSKYKKIKEDLENLCETM
ncbi:MAG: ATP cone domain-containing protein [Bacteroidota bacterium]